MSRCYNPNHSQYKYYGAKGVTVDDRWHDFWNFVEDVDNHLLNGKLLYEKGNKWNLDKDIKGGRIYSLNNCLVISADENRKFSYKKQKRKIIAFDDTKPSRNHCLNPCIARVFYFALIKPVYQIRELLANLFFGFEFIYLYSIKIVGKISCLIS